MRLFVLVYVKFTPDLLRMSPLNLAFELRRRCDHCPSRGTGFTTLYIHTYVAFIV